MAGARHLTLVRHAKSSWDDPDRIDFLRPLAPRGREAAPRVGARLRDLDVRPDLLLTSPATRARQTAALLRRALGPDTPSPRIRKDLYLADPAEWYAVLRRVDPRFHHVLAVGHNPGLRAFLEELCGETLASVPTGAAALLRVRGAWADLAPGRARLLDFLTPKSLKSGSP